MGFYAEDFSIYRWAHADVRNAVMTRAVDLDARDIHAVAWYGLVLRQKLVDGAEAKVARQMLASRMLDALIASPSISKGGMTEREMPRV